MPVSRPNFFSHLHLRWLFILGVGVLPFVVGIGLFRILIAANLNDITPTWSDEIYYWHQAATFRMAGFNGGYYTANEQPAPAAFTRYYAWGAAVPMVYGLQAQFFGWSLYAIPLMNMALLSVALIIFLGLIRATYWQILLTAILLATFVPFLLFSASSMIEVQQQAIAVLLATAFYRLLRQRVATPENISWWQWLGLIGLLLIATFLRPTWAILFVPLFMLALHRPTFKSGLLALILGIALFVFSGWLTQLMAAPDVKFVQSLQDIVRHFPVGSIPVLGLRIINNIQAALGGHPIEIHNRLLFVLLLVVMAVAWLRQKQQKNLMDVLLPFTQREVLLHIYNIGVILMFNLVLYDTFDWRDYRVMTPHLLFSLMLLVACQRYRQAWVMIVALILILPQIPPAYRSTEWYGKHADARRMTAMQTWENKFSPILAYQPDASSAWCNTILHTPFYLFGPVETLLAVPPGIGISVILDEDSLEFPLKSHYLLLDNEFYQRYADKLHLQPLLPIPNGMLSINLDANCRE